MTALDLQQFRVGSLPTVFYIPNYVSTEEEQALLTDLRASKQWRTVSGERQVPAALCEFNRQFMQRSPLHLCLQAVGCRIWGASSISKA